MKLSHYKKIGTGYFYTVYDIGNGRVRKKIKNKILFCFHIFLCEIWQLNVIRQLRDSFAILKKIPGIYQKIQMVPKQSLFGNPVFLDKLNYDQDKVIIINEIIHTKSFQETCRIIDDYILLIQELWKYGMHEKIHNFTINNGINEQGQVILIDFNEVIFDPVEIKKRIADKIYQTRFSYKQLPHHIKKYYQEQMDTHITIKNFEKNWNMYSV